MPVPFILIASDTLACTYILPLPIQHLGPNRALTELMFHHYRLFQNIIVI